MIVFLDDDPVRCKHFKSNNPSATIFNTAESIISFLKENKEIIDELYLDHDLGGKIYVNSLEKETGMEVVRFLKTQKNKNIEKIIVHSHNELAANLMTETLLKAGYYTIQIPFINILEGYKRWEKT